MTSDGASVWEARADADGRFSISGLPAGSLLLGASSPGLAYVEQSIDAATCPSVELSLGPETATGSWETLGDPGEAFGGTNSGVLLPDGRAMYCHDTLDPVIFDPVSGAREEPARSPRLQGCHAVSLMSDGRLIYVGGADVPVYGPGTRQVKTYDPVADRWEVQSDLVDPRWYPSMVPLPSGGFLTVGGGGLDNPVRLDTSEVMDPTSLRWTRSGDIALGNEVSPIVLLRTGDVLMTHRPPQLFHPGTGEWRLAGDFVQGDRMRNGDHADHEMVMLSDGTVIAIGFKTFEPGVVGQIAESYDPESDRWSLRANFAPVRSRASVVLLPDERILVLGGYKEDTTDPTPVNEWGQTALADLYDPGADAWRRLAPMSLAREYHAMPLLVPDGRVLVVGGEGQPGNEPPASVIEVFRPPYLSRGPRPSITDISAITLRRGDTVGLTVARTSTPSRVVMIGALASTHFMDSGPGSIPRPRVHAGWGSSDGHRSHRRGSGAFRLLPAVRDGGRHPVRSADGESRSLVSVNVWLVAGVMREGRARLPFGGRRCTPITTRTPMPIFRTSARFRLVAAMLRAAAVAR